VFVNLVDNAVKFSPEGSTIHLLAGPQALGESSEEEGFSLMQPSRRTIEVSVIDSGIGIPEEERERIFDAFYQVDSSSTREHEGTGLGLSIVKRLVDAHGGTVRVTANEPTGTIFSVVLPAAPQRSQLGGPPRRPG
jgi:signal transduction histidine kinase